MEQLSENVAFRQLDQLASNEVDVFFAYLLGSPIRPLGINEKFAPLLGYLAPAYELSGTEAVAPHIADLMHTSVHSIGLTSLSRMPGENSSLPFLDRYHVTAASKQRRELRSAERRIVKEGVNKCITR